jgi:S1-C subfamily serine protease
VKPRKKTEEHMYSQTHESDISRFLRKNLAYVALSVICCVTATAGNAAQHASSPTLEDRIKRMKTTAVQIAWTPTATPTATTPTIPQFARAGTGFVVSQSGYVLTAAHVIRNSEAAARSTGQSQIAFEVGFLLDTSSTSRIHFEGSFQWTLAHLVAVDETHDVAILKAPSPIRPTIGVGQGFITPSVTTATLDPDLPTEGVTVLISGYPLDIPTFVTQRGMIASESFKLARETPTPARAPQRPTIPEVVDSILLDAVVNPGNSGGPVYRSDSGDVIGLCDAYVQSPLFTSKNSNVEVRPGEFLAQNAGLAVVVPIKYAIELLKQNGVSDFITTSPPKHPKK